MLEVCHVGGPRNKEKVLQFGGKKERSTMKHIETIPTMVLVVSEDKQWRDTISALQHFGYSIFGARNRQQTEAFLEENVGSGRLGAVIIDGSTVAPTGEMIQLLASNAPLIVMIPSAKETLPPADLRLESITVSGRVELAQIALYVSEWNERRAVAA